MRCNRRSAFFFYVSCSRYSRTVNASTNFLGSRVGFERITNSASLISIQMIRMTSQTQLMRLHISRCNTPKTIRYKGASRTIIDPGRYRFYATSHVYRQLQPYVATISTRMHCLDASRAADLLFPVPVKVHARRAVKEIQVRSPQVRGGDTALMKIMLTALAPSSGTRIDLRWAGDTEFLVLPLRTVDVHPFQREVEVAISTKATTITRTVTLTATTIEPGAAASVTIRP